jgi:hypothetical protein
MIGLSCLIVAVVYRLWQRHIAESKVYSLIAGSTEVSLRSFTISGQQRRVVCGAPSAIRYFESAMRQAEPRNGGGGLPYELSLEFDDGTLYDVGMSVTTVPALFLCMPGGLEEGWATHELKFASPMPKKVAMLFAFLDLPWEELPVGVTMVLEEKNGVVKTSFVTEGRGEWSESEIFGSGRDGYWRLKGR